MSWVRSGQVGSPSELPIPELKKILAYEEMVREKMEEIRERVFARHPLTCPHVDHSLGRVKVGEISLFAFVSSIHRQSAMAACTELPEWLKAEWPIWGREILGDGSHRWKVNNSGINSI